MNQELAEALIDWEDHPDVKNYQVVQLPKIVDRSRWSVFYEVVYRNKVDDTYWLIFYGRGATEYQDNQDEGVSFSQVKPVQKTITVYEAI
jgi:hypothetical protein